MEIKTRKQAQMDGDKKFYTGRPCAHGHDSPRYVISGTCCVCAAASTKIYNSAFKRSKNEANFGQSTLVRVNGIVPSQYGKAAESLLAALGNGDPRAQSLLALWGL